MVGCGEDGDGGGGGGGGGLEGGWGLEGEEEGGRRRMVVGKKGKGKGWGRWLVLGWQLG